MARDQMDAVIRREIESIFEAAIDLSPADRARCLADRCGSDQRLRAEVDAMIAAHERAEGLLEGDVAGAAARALRDVERGRRIGPYRVLREVGRGGMGVVYLAERDDGQYRQRVAVKLIRAGPDADELRQRFFAERQILASLKHRGIAQLLDGGVTDDLLPFIVMEYVDGVPINAYCDQRKLAIEARLRLFHEVCAAVHYAHQNLIIHRDIKPGNILVSPDGAAKLLDFGIAKLLNPAIGPFDQPFTRTEFRAMTPEYASPEQVRGETVTTASDVYALGVVLYELLAGRRPYYLTSGSPHELAEVVCGRVPERPSVALTRTMPSSVPGAANAITPEMMSRARGVSLDRLRHLLDGDLDAIVMMALRKDANDRYGSVDLLWEDIQRYLDGLPVLAHRGSRLYRTRKFLGRHRVESAAAAVVVLSLAVGAGVAVKQASVAGRERDRAEQALAQSNEVSDFLVGLFRTGVPIGAPRDEATAADLLAAGTARVEELAGRPLVQAQMLDALGRVNEQMGRLDEADRMLRRALGLRRSQRDNTADVAASLNNLSNVVRQRGRYEDALRMSREALAIQQRVLGPRHPDVALTLTSVGNLTSNAAEAESLYRAARDIQRAAIGSDQLAITGTNSWLSDLLRRRGALADAEALLRENVSMRERVVGPEHPTTATSMTNLASFLHSYGNREAEAESLYNRSLIILRRQPVQWLPNLNGALSGLTAMYADRGDHVRAEALAREALDVRRRSLGPAHPYVTESVASLAEEVAAQRRYGEAEAMLRDAVAVLERTMGSQHSRVALMLVSLARVRATMGRRAEAEADLRRAVAIAESSPRAADRWTGAMSALLADLIARRRDTTESRRLFEHSASILRQFPSSPEPGIRAAYAALAEHYKEVKQPTQEEYFRRLAQGR